MIFLMNLKMWEKNKKKLVLPKDYFLLDATEDDDARLHAYTNCVTMDAINPPIKLVKAKEKEIEMEMGDIIDIDKIEDLEDKFFNGLGFNNAVMATISAIVSSPDYNIFIVMRNKSFKLYKKQIKKAFEKAFPVDFDFIEIFDGDIKSIKKSLNKDFKDGQIQMLANILRKREKDMEKKFQQRGKKRKHKK